MAESIPVFDVVIAGGAASGLALAAAVKQALGAAVSIAVVDPARLLPPTLRIRHCERWRSPKARGACSKASAPGRRSRRMLNRSSPWRSWTGRCATRFGFPICALTAKATGRSPIWRSTTTSSRRFRRFAPRSESSASRALSRAGGPGKRVAEISLADGRNLRTRLAVAADGARSKLRALAAIPAYGWDYDQAGIVATIAHERDHEGVAEQHFLPAGPFAILPLPGRQSSIVWNERRADARALVGLEPEDFLRQLELALHAEARRASPRLAGRGLSVSLPDRPPVRRRAAGARRRRRACRPSDRRPGPQSGPARRRSARRSDRRRDAARPRPGRASASRSLRTRTPLRRRRERHGDGRDEPSLLQQLRSAAFPARPRSQARRPRARR